jgi:pimeloyl-ACP methyl ester carboxylesterase
MLRGYIDGVTSSGHIVGWACDTRCPVGSRSVSIFGEDGTLGASGLAHLYRQDLVGNGLGTGWHGFRLKARHPARIGREKLILIDLATRELLHAVEFAGLVEDQMSPVNSVDVLLTSDPTMISSIQQLAGCERLFSSVINKRGVEAFVKLSYAYVLGRAADPSGVSLYSKKLRRREISPFNLLKILAESEEFRSRPRLLTSPMADGFPFE